MRQQDKRTQGTITQCDTILCHGTCLTLAQSSLPTLSGPQSLELRTSAGSRTRIPSVHAACAARDSQRQIQPLLPAPDVCARVRSHRHTSHTCMCERVRVHYKCMHDAS